ncbi:MAG: hypothetical protein EA385_15745 [Salinarimonadaceae bacterium]|nr:MAG: hypothetical protein EA385_15745 [Salinarimonadaceae bacterium]
MTPSLVSVISIARIVADHYGVELRAISGMGREAHVVRARHVIMFLARRLTNLSYARIGERVGGRDHSTVMHGVAVIERERTTDRTLARDLDIIESLIEAERRALLHFGCGLELDVDAREIAERVLSTRRGEFTVSALEVIRLAETVLSATGGLPEEPNEAGELDPVALKRRLRSSEAVLAELVRTVGDFVDATGRAARAHKGEEFILASDARNAAFAKLLSTYRDLAAAREADVKAKETEHA